MCAQVAQGHIGRQLTANELARGGREQNLPAMPHRQQASGVIEQRADVVIASLRDHAAVERHTDA